MKPSAMPKIIALNGSPHRHGNTVTLMSWVLEGCQDAGASVEWLHVVDTNIRYCQGCFTCLKTGACPIQDDFQDVRARLLDADGLVAGSPVYANSPTAQLSTLMNRLTLLNLWTNTFADKWSVGVATSGIAPTKYVAKSLASFFGRSAGWIGATTASVDQGYQPLAQVHPLRLPEQARHLGRQLIARIEKPSRFELPSREGMIIQACLKFFIYPMTLRHSEQFAGARHILEQKGRLPVS